jgi:thiamine pyrophosphate-dependent acetolactate synthase large subunit-like protein
MMSALVRHEVLTELDAAFAADPVILTLGGTAREMLAVAGRKPNHLINLDGMGQTVSWGLGVALGVGGDRKTLVVEGDGSLLMGLSVVSTVGHLKPRGLVVYILDNGVYLATGGQPTAAADMDLVTVALASGWRGAREVRTPDELRDSLVWAREADGPLLVRVHIDTTQLSTPFFLEDPVVLAEDFRRWLAESSEATA